MLYYFTSYHWTYFGFVKHILLHFSSSWPTRVRFVYSWADDTKAKTQYTEYSASLYASLINEMPNIHKVLHTIHVSITYLTHSFATPLIHNYSLYTIHSCTANPTWGDIFESSKLERLFCHVSVKRDVRALSFEL